MSYEIKAVYLDAAGSQFSAPVKRTESGWRLVTAHGERPIDFFIPDKTAGGGMLTFEDYVIRIKENLRGCDFIQQVNAIRSVLPWPQKPADPPSVHTEPESRLHLGERLGNEGPLQQVQRAYSEQVIAAHRKTRLEERTQVQSATNPRTAQQAQQARQARNEIAALKKRG